MIQMNRNTVEVVADPHARYYGVELSQRTLLPGDDARLGDALPKLAHTIRSTKPE